jgi:hypothetical protein
MKRIVSEGDRSSMPPPECAENNCKSDNLNRRGAMDLAKRLESYWHDRGYFEVRFWAEPIDERFEKLGTHELYNVKCNLVNGLPPSHPNNME